MAKEIEKKFLVIDESYKKLALKSFDIQQGYLSRTPEHTVRVRIKGNRGFITVKGITTGCVRDEWEYEIPIEDAKQMLDTLPRGSVLLKTRYEVDYNSLTWEIDDFHGSLQGLVIAEVELPSSSYDINPLPPFVGAEVTGNPKYYNSNLLNCVD